MMPRSVMTHVVAGVMTHMFRRAQLLPHQCPAAAVTHDLLINHAVATPDRQPRGMHDAVMLGRPVPDRDATMPRYMTMHRAPMMLPGMVMGGGTVRIVETCTRRRNERR
jgi:hypothetical protein